MAVTKPVRPIAMGVGAIRIANVGDGVPGADKLFIKSQNPQEWELAKAFLCDKYGKEIADFVIKEMD